jgi:hypothetical protein
LPPVESGALLKGEGIAPAESVLSAAVAADLSLVVKASAVARADHQAFSEPNAALWGHGMVAIEGIALLRADGAAPPAGDAGVQPNSVVGLEFPSSLRIGALPPNEISHGASGDAPIAVELWSTYLMSVTLTFSDGRAITFTAMP